MCAAPNPLVNEVSKFMSVPEWKKKGQAWYRNAKEVVQVLELQKSQYGKQYYINLGVAVKALGMENDFPKEQKCHIRTRLSSLLPDELQQRLGKALDLEIDAGEDRSRSIEEALSIGFRFLDHCRDLASIKRSFTQGELAKTMVRVELKQLLSN